MQATTERELFSPVQIGPFTLKHRVVMAPLTRSRSIQPRDMPGDLMLEYYGQRASGWLHHFRSDHNFDQRSPMVWSSRTVLRRVGCRREKNHG
jgi:2,4-dienoyl-CoA reductase-like NADH-dependent reductase (Old Yellow Enzyme family)